MKLRHAAPDEAQECEIVLRAAFKDFVRCLGRELSDRSFSELSTAIAETRVLIGLQGSKILGVLVYSNENDHRDIEHLAVLPDMQSKGIGSALLKRLEREAIQSNVPALELNTAEFMTDLVQMYIKHGFKIVRKGPPAHTRDEHIRVYMRKPIQRSLGTGKWR